MISIQEADRIIEKNIRKFPVIEIPLEEAHGAVLREDIYADRDLPPFNKSLMDGIAVKYTAFKKGSRIFKILGTQAAGIDALALRTEDGCTQIMTGAVLSKGADCVIPIEQVTIDDELAKVHEDVKIKRMMNVRVKGADHKESELLIPQDCILNAAHIATAAAVGKAKIKVSYKPKVAIISTGDELVDVHDEVLPFQIRKSNSYFMKAVLDNTRLFETATFHFKDNKKMLLRQVGAILEKFDVLVVTGGISMGKFDLIPEIMKELKVDILFQKVKQKPGKPFWYGRTKRNQPVFALPGNPIATQVGMIRHVIPNLKKALSIKEEREEFAVIEESVEMDTPFTFFLLIRLESTRTGQLKAVPVLTGGSGDFATVGRADGFMEIPENTKKITKGFVGRIFRFT